MPHESPSSLPEYFFERMETAPRITPRAVPMRYQISSDVYPHVEPVTRKASSAYQKASVTLRDDAPLAPTR